MTLNHFVLFCFSHRFIALLQSAEVDCVKVVVGCKSDKLTEGTKRCISMDEARKLATDLNNNVKDLTVVPYFETSSLNGSNIEAVFEFILNHCLPLTGPRADLKREQLLLSKKATIMPTDEDAPKQTSSKCAC